MSSQVRLRAYTTLITCSRYPSKERGEALELVSIEWLLDWAYRRELVHRARMQGGVERGRLGGGSDSCAMIGAGVSNSRNMGFEAPADAYTVADAVGMLSLRAAEIVRRCATLGVRPDWTPEPRVTYTIEKFNKVAVPGIKTRSGRPYMSEWYDIRWTGDLPEYVAARRAAYRLWACSLAEVGAWLREGNLIKFGLTGEVPDPEPWLGKLRD